MTAVLAPVPKQKVSIVECEDPGWTVWLDSQGDWDCPICGTGPNPQHGSYVRPLRDLPAQGTSVLIQATRRVADSPRAPRFTCRKNGMWGDQHAQASQRPSSTQSEAEPINGQRDKTHVKRSATTDVAETASPVTPVTHDSRLPPDKCPHVTRKNRSTEGIQKGTSPC
jgi:hypothetical protein